MTRLFGRSQPQRPSTPASAVKTTPYQGSGNTSSGISETLPPLYRHVASLVPTRVASLFGVAAIQLCVASLALVPCLGREFASYEFVPDGGEYSLSVDILRGGFGLQGQANLAGWLTQTFLLLATGTALILRSIHRNRSDTSKPGVRLWGTLAIVWTSASLATTLPIGPAVAAALLQMTNTPFGPQGLGWWVSLGSFCISITVFATFFRLRERLASLIALTPGLLLWCASTACVWFSVNDPRLLLLANATWLAGSGCILFATILAVRSSLREIDGLCKQRTPTAIKRKTRPVTSAPASFSTDDARPTTTTAIDFEEIPNHIATGRNPVRDDGAIDSDLDTGDDEAPLQRRLSKSERRRLRKLARNGRAA
ncbi:MAG: hypothetical protein MUQ67_11010 [Pirellulales bacterium]|nr:hypothetical protein [Pirellulales bacterium]